MTRSGVPLPMNRQFGVPASAGPDRLKAGHRTSGVPRTGSWSQCMRESEWRLPMNHSSQIRLTNDEIRRNDEIRMTKPANAPRRVFRHSGFGFLASFVIRHSSFNDLCNSGSWSQCAQKIAWGLAANRNVGQASRLPRRRRRAQTCHPARAGALAGQAGRLPYVGPLRSMVP